MKIIISALLASMIVIPASGMLPETPVTKLVMIITERNKRRLIARAKYLDLLT